MSNTSKLFAFIFIAVILVGGFWYWQERQNSSQSLKAGSSSSQAEQTKVPTAVQDNSQSVSAVLTAPSAALLQEAGYSVIKQELPDGIYYKPPAVYWRVEDTVTGAQNGNLLMVSEMPVSAGDSSVLFSYASSTIPFDVSGAVSNEAVIEDGRTVINFIKNGNYVVLIGPAPAKLEKLASLIAGN